MTAARVTAALAAAEEGMAVVENGADPRLIAEVDAKIGGSGDIVVIGTPKVSLRAGGSGRLRCEPATEPAD